MSFRIESQECQVMDGGLLIRTRVPKDQITDEMVERCAHWHMLPTQNNRIIVQVTDHYYNELLHEVEYRLIFRSEELRTEDVDNGRQTMSRVVATVQVERKGEWWDSRLAPKVGLDALEGETVTVLTEPEPPRRGRPPNKAAA